MLFLRKKNKTRVLVLDDDTSLQKLVSTLLRRQGHQVDVVSSGSQALEKIAATRYDALVLDVMTPTDGGFTVIRHLRESDPSLLKRVVLLTASPDSVLRGVEKDIFGIVHKPFEAAKLIETVARTISQ
jgi:CheY-like chemotaxis protein